MKIRNGPVSGTISVTIGQKREREREREWVKRIVTRIIVEVGSINCNSTSRLWKGQDSTLINRIKIGSIDK